MSRTLLFSLIVLIPALLGWVVMETGVMDGVLALKGKSLELNQSATLCPYR